MLLAVLLVGHVAKDAILRDAAITLVETATGFETELEGAELHFLNRTADFTSLRLFNPAEFNEREAIAIDSIHIETTWGSVWAGRPWLKKLHVDVPRVQVVRPTTGPTNFEILAKNVEAWQRASEPVGASGRPAERRTSVAGWDARIDSASASAASDQAPDIRIDELRIRLGRIEIVDYRTGRYAPVTIAHDVDHEQVYRDITDLEALAEDLAIDFTVGALVGGINELDDVAPALAEGIKAWLRRSERQSQPTRDRDVKDAEELFKDLLDNVAE